MNETNGMYGFTQEADDLSAIRARLQRMSDKDLVEYGKASAFLAGRSTLATWRVQLAEARSEWLRRHGAKERRS